MHGACDPSLDVSALLSSLSHICDSLGIPISQSALVNAEDVASSVAAQTPFTITHIDTAVGSTYTTTQSSTQSSVATSSGSSPSSGSSSTALSLLNTSTSVSQMSSATPNHGMNSARHEHAGSMLGLTILFIFMGLWH